MFAEEDAPSALPLFTLSSLFSFQYLVDAIRKHYKNIPLVDGCMELLNKMLGSGEVCVFS